MLPAPLPLVELLLMYLYIHTHTQTHMRLCSSCICLTPCFSYLSTSQQCKQKVPLPAEPGTLQGMALATNAWTRVQEVGFPWH